MQSKNFLVICSAALSLGLAGPVFAQTGGGSMSGGSSNGSMSGGSSGMSHNDGTDSAPAGGEGAGTGSNGASMGTAATKHGTGPDMRPGKSDNPAGTPETAPNPQ